MTREELFKTGMDIVYLSACAVNERVPDADRIAAMDLSLLYETADRQMLTGITAMALQSAGVMDAAFMQAAGKAIHKIAAFDLERAVILDRFEKEGIWYMPLKGAVIKDLYPKLGMRQMSDNDILVNASRMEDVQQIMQSLGYEAELTPRGAHDAYFKEPFYNFEIHRRLFSVVNEKLAGYYADVKKRLLPDAGTSCGRHFSDEDFYIYLTAHEYKHYSNSGTGIRALLDVYVLCLKKGETLDWPYIYTELDKLGLKTFEEENRRLAMSLFEGRPLSEDDSSMFEYMLSGGTYGNMNNRVENKLKGYTESLGGRFRYVFKRIFPSGKHLRYLYPVVDRHPILLPFAFFYRLFKGIKKNHKLIGKEIKGLARKRQSKEK